MSASSWPILVCLAVAAVAAVTDLRSGKVYNWLTAPALLAGFLLNGLLFGWQGVLFSVEGVGLAAALLIGLSFVGRLMGGGDAKLLLATGALLGPRLLVLAFCFGALVGGVVALGVMICQRRVVHEVRSLGRSVAVRVWGGAPMDVRASASTRLPYAVPLACGVLLAALAQWGVIGLW